MKRRTISSRLPLILTAALLTACGGDPEPAPEPPKEDPVTITGKPKEEKPAEPANVVIKMQTFDKEVMKLQVEDLVEVRLTKDRLPVRGTVVSVRPRELSVTAQGSSVLTHFKPEDVTAVELLFREDKSEVTINADAPLNEEETWLDRFADREILGKDPRALWTGRFAKNIPLTVARPFKLEPLSFLKRKGSKNFFLPDPRPAQFRVRDQVKLVGISLGTQRTPEGKDTNLGEVYLYLVRRGQSVHSVYSQERLQGRNFGKRSLERFLKNELVTLAVSRPNASTHLKIVRVRASVAKQYSRYLENTPDRPAVRRLRAQRSPRLQKAEKQVRAVYRAVDLTKESDLDKPIVIEVRVPVSDAGIHLLPFKKELGLD